MRGVGHQLALSPHRVIQRRARSLQPVEHGVEPAGELANLVVGVDVDAAAEILGLADVLRRLGHLAERLEHPPSADPTEDSGERDPAGEQHRQDDAEFSEDRVDAVERPRQLERRRGLLGTGVHRHRQHPEVVVADVHVAEICAPLSVGEPQDVLVDRELKAAAIA
jgi:hypothetical protein